MGSKSLEGIPEAGYLLATTYTCLSIGIAKLLMGLISVEKPAVRRALSFRMRFMESYISTT